MLESFTNSANEPETCSYDDSAPSNPKVSFAHTRAPGVFLVFLGAPLASGKAPE